MSASVGTARAAGQPAAQRSLAPVREAMLYRAHARAGQIIAGARHQAGDMLEQARAEAAGNLAMARQEGQQQAALLAAARRNHGRQDAQAILLRAQRDAYDLLRAQVRAAVTGLRREPGYEQMKERLTELAVRLAGPGATVTEHPDGGVVVRTPEVVVDCSLPRLADAAVAALGPQVAGLWEPGRGGTP